MDGQQSTNMLCTCILTAYISEESFSKKRIKQLSQKHFFISQLVICQQDARNSVKNTVYIQLKVCLHLQYVLLCERTETE